MDPKTTYKIAKMSLFFRKINKPPMIFQEQIQVS